MHCRVGVHGVRRGSDEQDAVEVTTSPRCRHGRGAGARSSGEVPDDSDRTPWAPLSSAERPKRVFGLESRVCPHCGGRLRVIANVTGPDVVEWIREHARREGLPRAPPPPARSTVV